jgi:NTP pyrophosphatase (non-canonical NTP hydrolase)
MSNIKSLTEQAAKVAEGYFKKFEIKPSGDWYVLKLQEELGELIQAHLMVTGQARTKGKTHEEITEQLEKEIADVFGMVLLLAQYNKVDIEKALEKKWLVWNK